MNKFVSNLLFFHYPLKSILLKLLLYKGYKRIIKKYLSLSYAVRIPFPANNMIKTIKKTVPYPQHDLKCE
jgi:hypothetical protein